MEPKNINDFEVVLHLEVEVAPEHRGLFFDFCRRAFPIYESIGGTKMALYEDKSKPGHFNEVAYYRSLSDYHRSEEAVKNDPAQSSLIKEWRSIVKGPPKVTTYICKATELANT